MADSDKSLPTHATELWELVVGYAKQETVEPLKSLGRLLRWGVIGAFLLGIGLIMLTLAGLRALQTETGDAFDGRLTWVPYVLMLVASLLVAVLAARAIGSHKRRTKRSA